MKVHELIEALSQFEMGLEVILQKDAEGNGYSPLRGTDVAFYVADSTYSGEAYREEDKPDDAIPCVVLFPIN